MIVTTLKDCTKYLSIHPLFPKAIQFLIDVDTASLEPGKYDIDGDDLFAIVSEYQGKNSSEAKPEAHKNYIDIQYVVKGRESIQWMPLYEAKEIETEYEESSDIVFFKNRPVCEIVLLPGHFAVLFPEDVHAPAISKGKVRKVILKIRV